MHPLLNKYLFCRAAHDVFNVRRLPKSPGFLVFVLLSLFLSFPVRSQFISQIPLQGTWRFKTDPLNQGIAAEWQSMLLPETVILPGSMADNDKGEEPSLTTQWTGSIYDSSWYYNPAIAKYRKPGDIKFPFWLTPVKYYTGVAWYQYDFEIPENWKGKHIELFLERPHWQTMVWIDKNYVGQQNSLSTPHLYDISILVQPGKHTLTIRVDNQLKDVDPGKNSHSVTDHTQGNWNGIVGQMKLEAKPMAFIGNVQLYPDVKNKSVKVEIVVNHKNKSVKGSLELFSQLLDSTKVVKNKTLKTKFQLSTNQDTLRLSYPMGDKVELWNEFNPALYKLNILLTDNLGNTDERQVIFGMREFKVNGTRFEVNGRPLFLRGTVECCVFPLTGYPPTDEASWTRIFSIIKAHGLNHMRFHSYCPPEAAFIAADKAGVYLQVEGPSWPNYSTAIGIGMPVDKYIYEETERILREYGNHPSFCMMAACNEPNQAVNFVDFLNTYVDYWKSKDSRRVYTGASTGGSWKIIPHSQYLVRAKPRGIPWRSCAETNFDYRDRLEEQKIPYVTHEMGQWCVFPNFDEIPKYTGTLKPKNFELFKEDLEDKHMGEQAHNFLMASGKLQAMCYKQEIEATLRTPGFAGFQLLGLNDFPGQGTALVGVLDAFWDQKGYISPSEFARFCNSTVPLARMGKVVYKNNEIFKAAIEIAHFGSQPLENATVIWKITNDEKEVLASGKNVDLFIPVDNCFSLDSVIFPLNGVKQASKLNLEVSIGEFLNNWNFWVYPEVLPETKSTDILIVDSLDDKADSVLEKGGKVLLLIAGKVENGKDVVQNFTPVFWNTSWFKMHPPHTLGIYADTISPVFEDFPTAYHSDLQWAELTYRQQVMNLENFPNNLKPFIQSIDTWFLNRRLAMLFEAKVGNGKIMVCSIDIQKDLENRAAARQLRYSIIKYMISKRFNPECKVDLSIIKELLEIKPRKTWDSFTKDVPAELRKGK